MNYKLKVVLVFFCVSVVLAIQDNPSLVSPEQQKAIKQEIMKVHAEMVKAAENSDADGLYSHVIDGCKGVIIQDGRIMMTRQESLNATKQGLAGLKDISYKFNRKNITVISPTTAIWVADGTTSVTIIEDGRRLDFAFAETIVFTLKDSQWKVFHAHRSVPNPR
jgi:ketosteroid isomerase-like protein